MTKYTDFDVRMKRLEKLSDYYLNEDLPIVVRLDGRGFSKYTAGLERPYCTEFHDIMVATTCRLIGIECNACVGYTQSDEISLIFRKANILSETYFAGRIQKICSILASFATAHFNHLMSFSPIREKVTGLPLFDCRVFNITNDSEAKNYLIWRQRDATRNSIQMAGQAYFSHNELHKKSCSDIQEMLHTKGMNWNNYPEFFKRGSLCRKEKYKRYVGADCMTKFENEKVETEVDSEGIIKYYTWRNRVVRVPTPIFSVENLVL